MNPKDDDKVHIPTDLSRLKDELCQLVSRSTKFALKDVKYGYITGEYTESEVKVSVITHKWWATEVEVLLYRTSPRATYVYVNRGDAVFRKVLEDVISALKSPRGRLWQLRLRDQETWEGFLRTLRGEVVV